MASNALETVAQYHQPEYTGCPWSGIIANEANDTFCSKYRHIWILIRLFLSLFDFCGDYLFVMSITAGNICDENNYYTMNSDWPVWIWLNALGVYICAAIGFLLEMYVMYNYCTSSNKDNDINKVMYRDLATYCKIVTEDVA